MDDDTLVVELVVVADAVRSFAYERVCHYAGAWTVVSESPSWREYGCASVDETKLSFRHRPAVDVPLRMIGSAARRVTLDFHCPKPALIRFRPWIGALHREVWKPKVSDGRLPVKSDGDQFLLQVALGWTIPSIGYD